MRFYELLKPISCYRCNTAVCRRCVDDDEEADAGGGDTNRVDGTCVMIFRMGGHEALESLIVV